jgi:hypothetical protein
VDIVVTTEGKDVPLGTALEFIANSADLNIDAAPEGGLKLECPAFIQMGSRRVVIRTASRPWTGELKLPLVEGTPPLPLGTRWRRLSGYAGTLNATVQPQGSEHKIVLTLGTNGVPGVNKPTVFDAKSISVRPATRDGKQVLVVTGTDPQRLEAQSMRIVATDDGKSVFEVVTERSPQPGAKASTGTMPSPGQKLNIVDLRSVRPGQVPAVLRKHVLSSSSSDITVTMLGSNKIVVSEPGSGPNGARGVWLTVYKIKTGKLVVVGSTFYKSHGPARPNLGAKVQTLPNGVKMLKLPKFDFRMRLFEQDRAVKSPPQ